jgi:hypothetical protein
MTHGLIIKVNSTASVTRIEYQKEDSLELKGPSLKSRPTGMTGSLSTRGAEKAS